MREDLLSKLDKLDQDHVQGEFLKELCNGASAIEETKEDEFGLFREFATLVECHELICAQSGYGESSQAEQRRGVDVLVALAWRRTEAGLAERSVRFERALRLQSQNAGGVNVGPTAIADVLVLSEHTIRVDNVALSNKRVGNALLNEASWEDSPIPTTLITTANLCGESKAYEDKKNRNQLLFDLSTMQRQQDAIGMDPFEIFGYAGAHGKVSMYSMHWVGARGSPSRHLWLQEHKDVAFDLKQPVDILRFYVFLRRLRDHILKNAHDAFTKLTADDIAGSLIERGAWRAADMPARRARRSPASRRGPSDGSPGDDDSKGPGAGGSGAGRDDGDDGPHGQRRARDSGEGGGGRASRAKRRKVAKEDARGAQDEASVRAQSELDLGGGDGDGGLHAKLGLSTWAEQKCMWDMQRLAAVRELGPPRRLATKDVEKLPRAPRSDVCSSYLHSMTVHSALSEPL